MQKKILLITEKFHQENQIKSTKNFQKFCENNIVDYHYAKCVVSDYNFNYKNNLKYKDFPLVMDINYKLKEKIDLTNNYSSMILHLNNDYFKSFNILIIAVDCDYTGYYGLYNEMVQSIGENWKQSFEEIYIINTNTLSPEHLEKEIELFKNKEEQKTKMDLFDKLVEVGKIKRYFDYNYNLNANVLLKEVYLNVFGNNKENEELYKKYNITKYVLMSLFIIKEKENQNKRITQILNIMINWKGSGKYKKNDLKYLLGVGTPVSQSYMLTNLVSLNLLDEYLEKKGILSLSLDGYKFINKLSSKIYDKDLPFRIDNWCDMKFEGAKEKIDVYLINYFNRQKTKNKSLKTN